MNWGLIKYIGTKDLKRNTISIILIRSFDCRMMSW